MTDNTKQHRKNVSRIYGMIAGNQLPGHVPLFFTETLKNYLAWQDRKEPGSVTNGTLAMKSAIT